MVAASKLQWVKLMLSELLALMQLPPTLFLNNLGAAYLSANPVFQSRMKHLAIDYHLVRDLVQLSKLHVVHVFAGDQLANAITKPLSQSCIVSICNKIGVIFGTPS